MNFEMHPIFPSPIGKFFRDQALTNGELEFVKNYNYEPSTLNSIGGDKQLFLNNKELNSIHHFCQNALNEFVSSIFNSSANLVISSSWLNRTKPGELHHQHSHQNSIFSGVFYFQTLNENEAPIQFYVGGSPLVEVWDINIKEYNIFNSSSWKMPVEQNTCIIFPSTLQHAVPKNTSNKDRYSIAFNTFFAKNQTIGYDNKATILHM
jgi:hypothetical protein